jgi:hypothetical protein
MVEQKNMNEMESDTVDFCSRCYSLKIKYEDSIGMDCCGDCGCTDFRTASFDEWEKLYKERYDHKYVEGTRDIKKSPIFQMSNDKLKIKVSNDPSWREICRAMYPTFPNWLSKADSVILLFAKLYQENRLDDLRMELIKRNNNKH